MLYVQPSCKRWVTSKILMAIKFASLLLISA